MFVNKRIGDRLFISYQSGESLAIKQRIIGYIIYSKN